MDKAVDRARLREYPDRPWVGVGVVVWRGDRVLLVERGRPPRQGEWGLPGGAQELGETVYETAIREVLEETAIAIRPTDIVTAVDSISRDETGSILFHYTLIEVAADYIEGEAEARSDVTNVRWAGLHEIERLVRWEATRRVIAAAARERGVDA